MSLQGTLDTFALPDVLRLLASTRKTGHLRLEGSRGNAGIWFVDGAVAAVAPPVVGRAPDAVAPGADALCDVLRSPDGAFAFEAGADSPVEGERGAVEPLLAEAEELLVEWRSLTAVVPSLGCTLSLRPALEAASVTVSAEQWLHLVAIGGGTTVGDLGAALAQGELAVSRTVKGLVEAGVAVVGPVPDPVVAEPQPAAAPEDAVEDAVEEPEGDDEGSDADVPATEAATPRPAPVRPAQPAVDGFVRRPLGARPGSGARPAGGARPGGPRPVAVGRPLSASLGELATVRTATRPAPVAGGAGDDDEQAAVARQLADLGPDAAAAVAAAAEASTPEEREAAIDAIQAEAAGQPVNRSALLKFLSSVRT